MACLLPLFLIEEYLFEIIFIEDFRQLPVLFEPHEANSIRMKFI